MLSDTVELAAMHEIFRISLLLTALLSALLSLAQESLVVKSKVAQDLSSEQIHVINELRNRAQKDLFADYLKNDDPGIGTALAAPNELIAIATVTEVTFPDGSGYPYTKVNLHVERLLRGTSDETALYAESLWVPPRPKDEKWPISGGGPRMTALDRKEPKVGTRYVIGYRFLYEDGGRAYISGAIDLTDPEHAETFPRWSTFSTSKNAPMHPVLPPSSRRFKTRLLGSVIWQRGA